MKVKEIMHTANKIDSNVSISEAAKLMDLKSSGSILIEENNFSKAEIKEKDRIAGALLKDKLPAVFIVVNPGPKVGVIVKVPGRSLPPGKARNIGSEEYVHG